MSDFADIADAGDFGMVVVDCGGLQRRLLLCRGRARGRDCGDHSADHIVGATSSIGNDTCHAASSSQVLLVSGLLRFCSAAILESPLRAGAAVGEPPPGGAAASEPPPRGAAIIVSPPHGGLHGPSIDAALYAEGHCMGLLLLVS